MKYRLYQIKNGPLDDIIQAIQYNGTNLNDIAELTGATKDFLIDRGLVIGDYIIKGRSGYYFSTKEFFEDIYEPYVEDNRD